MLGKHSDNWLPSPALGSSVCPLGYGTASSYFRVCPAGLLPHLMAGQSIPLDGESLESRVLFVLPLAVACVAWLSLPTTTSRYWSRHQALGEAQQVS